MFNYHNMTAPSQQHNIHSLQIMIYTVYTTETEL